MIQLLISSSALILVIALLRLVLRKRVSQRLIYGLWLLVALRLLIPAQLGQSSYSFAALTAPAVQQVQQAVSKPISGPDQEILYQQLVQEYISSQPASDSSASVSPDIQTQLRQEAQAKSAPSHGQLLKMVWLTGTAVMALWFLTVNLVFYRRARKISVLWMKKDNIPIRICPFIPSPCLMGLFRPTICLTPDSLEDETALGHILAHETTHLRHGDPLWTLVRCLCLCVYWFHPLVWMAALLSKRDCELACDEGALERLGEEARIPYGKTLMRVVTHSRSPAHILDMATSMSDSKKQLKERMCMIVKKQKTLLTAAIALIMICAFVTGCAFAGGSPSTTAPDPSEDSSGSATVPNTYPCTVRIEGKLYQLSTKLPSDITVAEADIPGHITSIVPITQLPTQDGQANFGVEGAAYAPWNDETYGQTYVIEYGSSYGKDWYVLVPDGYSPSAPAPSESTAPSDPPVATPVDIQVLTQQLQGYWVDLSDVKGPDPATGIYVYAVMWVMDTHIGFGISYTDARVDGTITEVKQLGDGKYEVSYYVAAIGSADSDAYPYQEAYTKTITMEIGENTVTTISGSEAPVVYTYMCQDQGSLEDTLSHINSLLNDQNEA